MLAYLRGPIVHIEDNKIVVTPEGVGLGYEVLCPVSVLVRAKIGEVMELYLHHHITDVSQVLFGFGAAEERIIFRKLLKVDGVGGRTALSLMNLGLNILVQAIETSDEKVLAGANGVGKKTALKIIVELKKELTSETLFASEFAQVHLAPPNHQEIIDTLTGMGYDRKQVEKTVKSLPENLTTIQDQVVWAIRELATRA